eukprot:6075151-Prymnesium_polylepis.1
MSQARTRTSSSEATTRMRNSSRRRCAHDEAMRSHVTAAVRRIGVFVIGGDGWTVIGGDQAVSAAEGEAAAEL